MFQAHSISKSENKQALHASTSVVFLRSMEQIYVPTEASSKVLESPKNVNRTNFIFSFITETLKSI